MEYPIVTKVINPLQVLLGQVMGRNLTLVRLKQAAIPAATPMADCLRFLDSTVPAGTACLLFTEASGTVSTCPEEAFQTVGQVGFHVATGLGAEAGAASAGRTTASPGAF